MEDLQDWRLTYFGLNMDLMRFSGFLSWSGLLTSIFLFALSPYTGAIKVFWCWELRKEIQNQDVWRMLSLLKKMCCVESVVCILGAILKMLMDENVTTEIFIRWRPFFDFNLDLNKVVVVLYLLLVFGVFLEKRFALILFIILHNASFFYRTCFEMNNFWTSELEKDYPGETIPQYAGFVAFFLTSFYMHMTDIMGYIILLDSIIHNKQQMNVIHNQHFHED